MTPSDVDTADGSWLRTVHHAGLPTASELVFPDCAAAAAAATGRWMTADTCCYLYEDNVDENDELTSSLHARSILNTSLSNLRQPPATQVYVDQHMSFVTTTTKK